MNLALLAAVLLAATPQAQDSALSHRLRLEALERHVVLDLDSSLVLFRAARDAAPASLVAHLEYIGLAARRRPGGIPELRAEYETLPPSPLHDCLTAYLSVSEFNLPAVAPALMRMEARGTGDGCPTVLLAEIVGDMVPRNIWEPRRLEYLKRALDIAPDAWWLWMNYASALAAASAFDEADAALTDAMVRFPHPRQTLRLQMRKASILVQRGDTASGLALNRAVAAAVARDGRPGLRVEYLITLREVVDVTNLEGNALDSALRTGALLSQEHAAWDYEWRFRFTLALRLTDRGQALAALPEYARQIEIADSVGNRRHQVPSYMKRGRALERLGRLDEAEADLLHAIRVGTGAELPYWLAESYHNLALVYESAGRLAEASWAADRFIETIRPLRHSQLRITAFRDAAEIRWKAGWHATARRALDSMVRVVDHQEQYRYFAGEYFERSGNLGSAKRYYSAAVADRENLSRNLSGLVRVYRALGQLDSAEHMARQHDRILTEETDVLLEAEILAERGVFDEAVNASRAWAEERLAAGNVGGAATAHLQWANLLLTSGQAAAAIPVLDRVDSLAAIRNLTRLRIESTRLRGVALAAEGNEQDAIAALDRAARMAREHPTAESVIATHVSLGEALEAAGRPLDALDIFDVAAKQAHTITGSLEEDFDRVRHRGQNMAPFDGAVRVLLRLPDSDETVRRLVDWSQRRKAAALALATERANRNGLGIRPLSLAEIWTRLGPKDALIDYLVTDSAAAAIVVTRGRVSLHRLPLTADSLDRLVGELRKPLAVTFNGRVDLARVPFRLDLSRALYDALIAPPLPELEGVQRLLLVPDGVLHYVPFAALVSSAEPRTTGDAYSAARYLVDQYESLFLPSAAFLPPNGLAADRPTDRAARVLAVTHEAPGGEREVRTIEAVWRGGQVERLEGDAATETVAQGTAADYDVLHFAVHAIADDADPLASHLRLAPDSGSDGFLHSSEIAAQSHTGQLVVLSACETQMGRLYHGEGIMSLTRAFLATGATAVIATQWPIGAAAADLMTGFYRSLAAGADPATALRTSQRRLRHDARTSHPFYWAGFGLHVGG